MVSTVVLLVGKAARLLKVIGGIGAADELEVLVVRVGSFGFGFGTLGGRIRGRLRGEPMDDVVFTAGHPGFPASRGATHLLYARESMPFQATAG
jgi:hypothetical protein